MLIGELAHRARTSTRTLRYYEERGLLDASRDGNGYRIYSESAVLRVRQIRGLLSAGFSSDTIALLLPCAHGEQPTIELCPSVVAEMRRTLRAIEDSLVELTGRQQAIRTLLEPTP
jgi:DNA-binding transcriptional MerR regulator